VMYISDDTNDGQPWACNDAQTFAQRIFVGEILLRHCFIDDRGRYRLWIIEVLWIRLLVVVAHYWQSKSRIGVGGCGKGRGQEDA